MPGIMTHAACAFRPNFGPGREEGTFRRHMLLPDGTWRDSVYFSVIRPEWPEVKARLTSLRVR